MIAGPRGFSFTIPGRLGAWQRATHWEGRTLTPAKMRSDQAMVRQIAALAMSKSCKTPLMGPLMLVVNTYRQPPRSWSLKKQAAALWIDTKPDFDNTLKLIADALNKVAYYDDAQIAWGTHMKRYRMVQPECVNIALEELEATW